MNPDSRHLDALHARIESAPWTAYFDELKRHLHRERSAGDTRPDGYPTRHGSPSGGSGGGLVVDDERIPATGVEIAAIMRIELGTPTDEHHRRTWGILRELERIVEAIDAIEGHRRQLGILTRAVDPEGWCEHHTRLGVGSEPVSDRYAGLCRYCGDWRAARGDLPPKALLERRQAGERITTKVIAEVLGERAS